MKRNHKTSSDGRLRIIKRFFQIARLFASGRCQSMHLATITEKLKESTGEGWSTRTVRRDLQAMTEIGLVTCDAGNYVWTGDPIGNNVFGGAISAA
ncbi:MAG: hypothetical protein AAFX06_20040 [Planctomycetota bacterium]